MSIAQLDEVKVKIRQFERKLQSNPNDLDTIRILAQLEASKNALEEIVNPPEQEPEVENEPEPEPEPEVVETVESRVVEPKSKTTLKKGK